FADAGVTIIVAFQRVVSRGRSRMRTRHVRVSRAPAKLGIALAGLSFSTFFWFADAAHAAGVVEAARDGDLATVRELIGAGADANAAANDGSTPLLWAAYHSDV